jgi:WhiB family transcriptional regulator, redox-sensing transcriptional regulator
VSYQSWRDKAACSGADPDLFFPPEKRGKTQAAKAKAICARCPVTAECLAVAAPFGIWGGTAEGERDTPAAVSPPAPRVTRPAPASRYPGVTWKAQRRTWTARVPRGGKRKYLGSFKTEREAWQAVCEEVGLLVEGAA